MIQLFARLIMSTAALLLAFHGGMFIEQSNVLHRSGQDGMFSVGLLGMLFVGGAMALVIFPMVIEAMERADEGTLHS